MTQKRMRCRECVNGFLTETVENHKYTESGLTNVTLCEVSVRRCDHCGWRGVVIPRVEELHSLLCELLAQRRGRLEPSEIRFIRSSLGFSKALLGETMGVEPSTVLRWERGDSQMRQPAEHLLRMLALQGKPLESYRKNMVDLLKPSNAEPMRLRKGASKWMGPQTAAC